MLTIMKPTSGPMSRSMRRATVVATCAVAACVVAALSVWPAAAESPRTAQAGHPYSSGKYAPRGAHLPFAGSDRAVCAKPRAGVGQCLIHVLKPSDATPEGSVATPTGLPPSVIKGVYGFSTASGAGAGQTIALVDAYSDPDAASDLDTFSSQYGLPLECTGGSLPPSCFDFNQVNLGSGSGLPSGDEGWGLEMSLDIEWAHALAPAASILLVEAAGSDFASMLAAEQYAGEHANYVSNSWGAEEFSGETAYDSYFTQPGVSYFAAAGDDGAEVLWPSSSPDVISVGGTSLSFTSAGTLAQETAWSGSGGGCSSYESANIYQSTGSVNCAGARATPDLSLDADPDSGVSVYDSISFEGQTGWWTVGGTSASTAMVAAEAAVTGADVGAKYVYTSPANIPFRDITSGSNGYPAEPGYDLVTGLGSWSYTPGTPGNLTATSASGVTLRWSAPSGAPVSDYTIWRGTAPGEESTAIATVNAPTTTYTDSSAAVGETYYYVVQAANGLGVGPFSNEVSAEGSSSPANPSYTVTFNANNGNGSMAAETDNVPTALTLNTFTRSGYSFSGWNTAPNGSGTAYADGATYPFTASVTLYAQWTANTGGNPSPPPGSPSPTPVPSVTGISPASGPPWGGTAVTITGTGFSTTAGGTTVDFGATPAAVSCSSTTSCIAISPAETPYTVNVTVSTSGGTSRTSAADLFSYVSPPTVTKITPANGPTKGGTAVTISGTNFLGSVSVAFGATPATSVHVLSATQITATSPSGSGTVYVTVSAAGGSSSSTGRSRFTFVAAPTITKVTPDSGSVKGDTTVTIWGSNFVGTVSVYFGSTRAASVHVLSSSEIRVTAPKGSGTTYVTVSAVGGSSKKTPTGKYRY